MLCLSCVLLVLNMNCILHKIEMVVCPYLRLTAETETQFLRNCSQFQAACMK